MGHNLADMDQAQRERLAAERAEALERHHAKKRAELEIEAEFQRLLNGKSVHKGYWRAWVRDQLAAMEDEARREAVRKKLNDWMDQIGG